MKPGDLVKYVDRRSSGDIKRVIPTGVNPVGIVVSVHEKLVEYNSEPEAIMRCIKVRWSIEKWNGQDGLSEECMTDLQLIQKA